MTNMDHLLVVNPCKNMLGINFKSQTKINSLPEIIHWSNIGKASWYDVAKFILNISLELKYPLIT